MNIPVEITSKNVHLSDELEELIREKAGKLGNFFDRIISCRVVVDIPHRSQRSGIQYNVRIDLSVPGGEVVVKKEPDEDLFIAITSSFDAAERQLKVYVAKQRGEVKFHESKPFGRVARVFPLEGYGFLVTPDGRDVYFHENALINTKIEELQEGAVVSYVERMGEEGAQASSVTVV